jgi:curved DNA-binding protein CbpA
MTHYDVLQVSPLATVDVINASWKALVRKNHADVNHSQNAKKVMLLLNEAHEVLSDPAKRAQYDRNLESIRAEAQTNGHSRPRRRGSPGGAYEPAYQNGHQDHAAPMLARDPRILMEEYLQGVADTGQLAMDCFLDTAAELALAKLQEMSPALAGLLREELKLKR